MSSACWKCDGVLRCCHEATKSGSLAIHGSSGRSRSVPDTQMTSGDVWGAPGRRRVTARRRGRSGGPSDHLTTTRAPPRDHPYSSDVLLHSLVGNEGVDALF